MEADIFENEHFSVAQSFALAFGAWPDAIEREPQQDCREALLVFSATGFKEYSNPGRLSDGLDAMRADAGAF